MEREEDAKVKSEIELPMSVVGTVKSSQFDLKPLPDIWLKAAMLGSLWASVEIILGSFLHNLHIPLSGTFLASLGLILMINGYRLWPNPGLFWRTALVTAAMKSISPSAIIIGPMIGIFMEGLILEIFVRLFRGRWPGFVIGGALAVSWSLFQKIFVLLMTYGPDFVKLYEQLYFVASRSLGFEGATPIDLVKVIFIVDLSFGAVVAGLAFRTIQSKTPVAIPAKKLSENMNKENLLVASATQAYSVSLWFVNLFILVLGLTLLDDLSLAVGSGLVVLYVALNIFRYNRSLKRLKRPQLWLQLIAIMGLSGLLLGGWDSFGALLTGLETGMSMAIRALLVIFAFSALSIELRNPTIIDWFTRKGVGVLFDSLSLAFEVLPRLLKSVAEIDRIWRHPFRNLNQLLGSLEDLRREHYSIKPKVLILTGQQGDGKTSMIKSLVNSEVLKGLHFTGFYCEGDWINNERDSYHIVDIKTQASRLLCERAQPVSEWRAGPFNFRQTGLDFGREILDSSPIDGNREVIIIDEIGHLELQNSGWNDSLDRLVNQKARMIWTIRPALLDAVIAKWPVDYQIVDIQNKRPEEVFNIVQTFLI